jgi:hypothetical protein
MRKIPIVQNPTKHTSLARKVVATISTAMEIRPMLIERFASCQQLKLKNPIGWAELIKAYQSP